MNVVSLFDVTGRMVEPWAAAGYQCWTVDLGHPGEEHDGNIHRIRADLSVPWLPPFDRDDIAFVAAFPPCDHLAVSGARWFKGKGLRALARSVELFATAAEFCEWADAPYLIENPVSTIATYWRPPDHQFHPWHYTFFEPEDNYTKTTWLWTGGGFQMPEQHVAWGLGEPDDRIHRMAPGPDRAARRSATPIGFARAVFAANAPTEVAA